MKKGMMFSFKGSLGRVVSEVRKAFINRQQLGILKYLLAQGTVLGN